MTSLFGDLLWWCQWLGLWLLVDVVIVAVWSGGRQRQRVERRRPR